MASRNLKYYLLLAFLLLALILWSRRAPSPSEEPALEYYRHTRVVRNCITQNVLAEYQLEDQVDLFIRWMKYSDLGIDAAARSAAVNTPKAITSSKQSGILPDTSYAHEAVAALHALIDKVRRKTGRKIVRILDIPCGSLKWLYHLLKVRSDVFYTGMDIDPQIIEHHKKKFINPNWKFFVQDSILMEKLPDSYDIIISRHMLQRFSQKEILRVLNTFSSRDGEEDHPTYFFTSIHYHTNQNARNPDTKSRHINLELAPFSFVPPMCLVRECQDCAREVQSDHYIAVYNMPFMATKCENGVTENAWREGGWNHTLFSCTKWKLM